jgi:two-component system response regulator FixJ
MVYIVEDDLAVLHGLAVILQSAEFRVAIFESAEEFFSSLRGNECGCVLLDFRLGGMNGLQALQILRTRNAPLVTIMITGESAVTTAVESMKLGAMDFLEKPVDSDLLVARVEEAVAQAESMQLSRAQVAMGLTRLTALSPREREILQKLAAGKSSKQIAAETGISLRTVSNHRAHLLAKTGAGNTADLVRMAVVANLVVP